MVTTTPSRTIAGTPVFPSFQSSPSESIYAISPPDRSSVPSSIPQVTVLYGDIAPGWTIAEPLPVTIERDDDGSYIASDDIFDVYGDAWTPGGALEDYVIALTEYYELLAESAEGHPPTQALFHHLRQYLRTAAE
jgi:hypothetical protein